MGAAYYPIDGAAPRGIFQEDYLKQLGVTQRQNIHVSYTHLDVYKRQVWQSVEELKGSLEFFAPIAQFSGFIQMCIRDRYPSLESGRWPHLRRLLLKGCLLYTSRCV